MIDGLPDSTTEELAGASVEVVPLVGEWGGLPDPHATFAASVMVGQGQGLAPHARLLAFGVKAEDESIRAESIARAIDLAVRRGARIIVIPLGDHHSHESVGVAIDGALARGIAVVASAGNAHPHPLLFPARLPGVLAVGACDHEGVLLEDCCRTPRLDLVVPALRIRATDGPGREVERSGTSVAAALAGGLLALDPSLPCRIHPFNQDSPVATRTSR